MNFVAPLEDIAAILAKTARSDALIVEWVAKWISAELACQVHRSKLTL
jgi:hypothetical protein